MKRRVWLRIWLAVLCLAASLPPSVQTRAAEAAIASPEGIQESQEGGSSSSPEGISIDTEKTYPGMSSSFAKGYVPSVKKNTLFLVVPFQTKLPLADDCLYVGISFEREENCPFLFKNYQKKVVKSDKHTYLYRCKIKLRKNRVNGQYPLHLTVRAQTAAGDTALPSKTIQQDFTIYVEITDGKTIYSASSDYAEASENSLPADTRAESDNSNESGDTALSSDNNREIIHQPRIMLTGNNIQTESGNHTESLQAGTSVRWSVTAKNCSTSQPVENMKVTLLSENNHLLFEKSSWYFDRINAETMIDLSQAVTVDKKAPAETIPIQFQFDYEDKNGTAYSVTETTRLSIAATQQAELVDLSFPESIYEADTNSLTFQVQNTGPGLVYNARVRMEGKGLFPERELFLGNIEPGTSSDGEIPVFAGTLNMDETGSILDETGEKYGITTARVIFSYEDEQGAVTEQEFQVQTAIKKPQTVELTIEEKEPETNQWWFTIVFFIILTLVLLNIWLYLRMNYYRRRRKDSSWTHPDANSGEENYGRT